MSKISSQTRKFEFNRLNALPQISDRILNSYFFQQKFTNGLKKVHFRPYNSIKKVRFKFILIVKYSLVWKILRNLGKKSSLGFSRTIFPKLDATKEFFPHQNNWLCWLFVAVANHPKILDQDSSNRHQWHVIELIYLTKI